MLDVGVDLALGPIEPVCYIERDAETAEILAARIEEGSLPPAHVWSDLTTFDAGQLRGAVDCVTAGFPCQPFSVAGQRAGTEDARWIWPDIARIIRECGAWLVCLENVPGLLRDPDSDSDRWELDKAADDAPGGMGTVLRDLAELGFTVEWLCLRASDVGASHQRKRWFALAYSAHDLRRRGIIGAQAGVGAHDLRRRGSPVGNGIVEHAQRTERRPGAEPGGCSEPRRNGQGQAASGPGDGIGLLAESELADANLCNERQFGRIENGRRSRQERSGGESDELADARSSRRSEDARGPSADEEADGGAGRNPLEQDGYHQPECIHAELADAARGGFGERREPSERRGQPDGSDGAMVRGFPIFAPGPSDPIWQDLLVRFPWLRPSLSQAEAESHLRGDLDGLARMVVHHRTAALRCIGNGVVDLCAAAAFVELSRRAAL